ncbi:3-oxoadipate enol-lactonase [Telluria beijingensis]|uniref:3-oxoadipate enol-lactonase n=1 Tax=Telluria beijingensis TaxID=3068633 RepID=UPI00279587A2|nr:3-oxoadipate enol-lactonase [Massilia sp. REN29]
MAIATVNGTLLHYRLQGSADRPTVVLSNSLGTDMSMWDDLAYSLASRFQVLRYDTRGHGASKSPAGPYTLKLLGRDVLALLDTLGIGRAHFVGLSMGGAIGQWLGVHAPQRLERLVLANTAARIGSLDGWRARAAAVRASGMEEIAAGSPGRWFTPAFVGAQPELVRAMQAVLLRTDPEGYAACCDALAGADLRAAVAAIPVPTLVIAGAFDPVTTADDARFLQQAIPGSTLAEVPASHLSNLEAPELFAETVHAFLDA